MLRLTWFLSHPIQYFSPLLKELAKKSDLTVFYYLDPGKEETVDKGFGIPVNWDTDLLGGYSNHFIRNYSSGKSLNNRFRDAVNPGVFKIIKRNKKSVNIVNGWSYCSDLMVLMFSGLMGRKVWLRAENPLNQELKKGRITLFFKKIFLKTLFRLCTSKCLYIGKESKSFFKYYGVPDSRLIYTPYSVDNHFFSSRAEELRGKSINIKKRLGLPSDRKIILFSGKYIPKKNPMDLLKAFQILRDKPYALVMVGEGMLRAEMEKFIQENQLQSVFLTGFINQLEISDYYSISDVFVMCSGTGETWGLSVNEAMNFGKPVIVSDICGCSSDLVKHGLNGFVFPEGDIYRLAGHLNEILGNEKFCSEAGVHSLDIIKEYSIERVVYNLCNQ